MAPIFFAKNGKRKKQTDKERTQDLMQEILEKLDQVARAIDGKQTDAGALVQDCIREMTYCRRELNMMLAMRDRQAEEEFYRRAIQLLNEILDTLKKMNYFYTYIESMVYPKVIALHRLLDDAVQPVN